LNIKTIMGSREHAIVGHERLRCDTCHTQAVPQCYGCHTTYDERVEAFDLIREERLTRGGFSETEDLRTLYPFPLVVDEKGRIAPSTPGCQTLLTYIDKDGLVLFKDLIPEYQGTPRFKFVPFYAHSTGKKAIGCRECHGNPAFAGLGDGLVSLKTGSLTSAIRCSVTGLPLNAILEIKNGKILSRTAVPREGGRPLNKEEIRRFFRLTSVLLAMINRNLGYMEKRSIWIVSLVASIVPLLQAAIGVTKEEPCLSCHQGKKPDLSHAQLACSACHALGKRHAQAPDDPKTCLKCHSKHAGILKGPMATRLNEERVVQKALGKLEPNFFKERCTGCHLQGCLDCHRATKGSHGIGLPDTEACLSCHNGYFTGIDYTGLALREDHERYQRGPLFRGQHYLRMLPDVHFQKGMPCRACHSMKGHESGKTAIKSCQACHPHPSERVIEHSVPSHLTKMTCSSCHASWALQEYGTFLIKIENEERAQAFKNIESLGGGYYKGSYLKEYGLPPIGLNDQGLYSLIRPEFIFFHTKVGAEKQSNTKDNVLLGAFWKAFSPHTIRKETPLARHAITIPSAFCMPILRKRFIILKRTAYPWTLFLEPKGRRLSTELLWMSQP